MHNIILEIHFYFVNIQISLSMLCWMTITKNAMDSYYFGRLLLGTSKISNKDTFRGTSVWKKMARFSKGINMLIFYNLLKVKDLHS